MPARAMQTPANFLGGIWSPKKATPPASTMMSFRWPITLKVRPDVAPIIRNVDHDTSSPKICTQPTCLKSNPQKPSSKSTPCSH